MSLNSLIINTLQPLGVPVSLHTYSGKETTYIAFFEFNQMGKLYADDSEVKTSYSVQVDICSKSDYTALVEQVKNTLINIGFTRTMETEIYENATETYRKVLRFNFVQ